MNLGDVERELRHGPPEERDYRVREIVLDDTDPASVAAVRRPRSTGALRQAWSLGLAAVVIAGGLAGAFVLGRASAPVAVQPAAPPSVGVRVQPAFVADAIGQAFYSGVRRDATWLVCEGSDSVDCIDVPAFRTSDIFGSDEWPNLHPGTVKPGDVIVGAQLDPVTPVSAYLISASNPSAGGPQLTPVTIHPGDTFFDLGPLAPGRYVVSVLIDPTTSMVSGQTVIGIDVEE
jgi:hypothetical protein